MKTLHHTIYNTGTLKLLLKELHYLEGAIRYSCLLFFLNLFLFLFTGMRMMKSTLVGVVCLDPKKLLEDGIRKELVQHISKALHSELIFSSKSKADDLEQKLKLLVRIMDGYKRSFEYIQVKTLNILVI